jgi:hypothetical protein
MAWPLASVWPPLSALLVAPLLLVISEKATVCPLTGLPEPSVPVAVIMLDSPAAREVTVDVIAMLYPADVLPPVPLSKVPPQAVRNKSIAKHISSDNVRDDLVLFDFIILLSFLLGTDDILFRDGKILP